ncbi:MAG: RecX family transcriptional regulator [Bacteroidetes bacterium]|jgi:regulatory protein|nr:RecX family transcriptional regulator [Bacteroidota bacterium]
MMPGLEPWLTRAQRYCAQQERSAMEVLMKLQGWGCPTPWALEILRLLQDERYQDEQRFASLYVRSKANQNQWGRQKIAAGLARKGVPGPIAEAALQALDGAEQQQRIQKLMRRKLAQLPPDSPQRYERVVRYLLQKGFSYPDIRAAWDVLLHEK